MNNYKKTPFIPAIQKTSTLVILSAISLVCFIVSINVKTTNDRLIRPKQSMNARIITLRENRLGKGTLLILKMTQTKPG